MRGFLNKNIFLVDAVGALGSAVFLGLVLPHLKVGVPKPTLVILSVIALLFGIYSLSCFFFKPRGTSWLKGIAVANTLYCLATALIVGFLYERLSILGIAYFSIEIGLILALVVLELQVSKSQAG